VLETPVAPPAAYSAAQFASWKAMSELAAPLFGGGLVDAVQT